MALTTESLQPLLDQLKREIKADIEEVVKKELSSLNLAAIIDEQNRKIDCLTKDNCALKKSLKKQGALLESIQRQNNVVLYGVQEEAEESYDALWVKITELFRNTLSVEINDTDLDFVRRIGLKSSRTRPIVVRFVSAWKRNRVLRNSYKLKGTAIFLAQDYDKDTRAKRKELLELKNTLIKAGHAVILRRGGLVVDGVFTEYDILMKDSGAIRVAEEDGNVKKRKRNKGAELLRQSVADFFRPRTGSGSSAKSVEH